LFQGGVVARAPDGGVTTRLHAPVDRVWALITEPEHVGTWFADAGADIDLRPGGAMTMRWEEYGTVLGRVERVEPQRLFAYRWSTTEEEPREGHSTLVEFSLSAEGHGTRVRVVETGFASLDAPEAERRQRHEQNTEGWAMELGHLSEHAARVAA
jgi:uncharacterized protein YndB with AHSA1/START domain